MIVKSLSRNSSNKEIFDMREAEYNKLYLKQTYSKSRHLAKIDNIYCTICFLVFWLSAHKITCIKKTLCVNWTENFAQRWNLISIKRKNRVWRRKKTGPIILKAYISQRVIDMFPINKCMLIKFYKSRHLWAYSQFWQ